MNDDSAKVEVQPAKHERLDRAIDNINNVNERIDSLLARITGNDVGEALQSTTLPPNLEDVLNGGPDRINKRCDEMVAALEEIEHTLF